MLVNQKPWQGEPGNLADLVTPLDVTIINDSTGPVPIRYRDFTLDTEQGMQLRAVPPLRISRPAERTVVVRPIYPSDRFSFYGPYASFYPGYPVWDGPFDSDLSWYDSAYQWQQALPTPDMLQKALPEGMLQQGGHVSGYLYFSHVPGKGRVNFQARFPEAKTGRTAALVIPLTSG